MDKRGTQTDGLKNKEIYDDSQDIDRLYVSRKEGWWGLISIGDFVAATIQEFKEKAIKKEPSDINKNNLKTNRKKKKTIKKSRKQNGI